MSRIAQIFKRLIPEASSLRVIMLCILAATTFWFFNALNENYTTTLPYPVKFTYDQTKYIAVDALPENVQINVSGLGWNLFRSSLGIKIAPLDIPLENPSEVKKISSAVIPALITDQLSDLQLNYVLTDTLFVNIDRIIEKRFLIVIDSATISLEENYLIDGKILHTPDSIVLKGPETILNQFSDTLTVKIPQEDIDEDYDQEVPVSVSYANLIHRNPPTINVVFGVAEYEPGVMEVGISPVNFPTDSSVYLSKGETTVVFDVKKEQAENIKASDFLIEAPFGAIISADSTILPELKKVPETVQNVRMDTSRIKVIYNK